MVSSKQIVTRTCISIWGPRITVQLMIHHPRKQWYHDTQSTCAQRQSFIIHHNLCHQREKQTINSYLAFQSAECCIYSRHYEISEIEQWAFKILTQQHVHMCHYLKCKQPLSVDREICQTAEQFKRYKVCCESRIHLRQTVTLIFSNCVD